MKAGDASVGERIPRCGDCNVPVLFNGCTVCGHLFNDTDWDDLPTWDASAKACLEVSLRHRRAAQLLAAQVRHEASLLAHERVALEEARGYSDKLVIPPPSVEPPPPPPSLPPRCGASCRRVHRGFCLVCDRDVGHHHQHTCSDGRRGSWRLVADNIVEGELEGSEEEEEEE